MWKNSPHEKCEENLKCGELMFTICGVLSHFTIFCCKISFVVIFADLSRNLFWYNLCAFAWRKLRPKLYLWWRKDMLRQPSKLGFFPTTLCRRQPTEERGWSLFRAETKSNEAQHAMTILDLTSV